MATEIRTLSNGRLVEVDATGRATFHLCSWLIEVPSNDPEPCCHADTVRIVECGARTVAFHQGFACDNGHEFGGIEYELSAYGPEWQREQAERGARV